MSISKKTLSQVKRQIFTAQAEEARKAAEAGEPPPPQAPSAREQLKQARLSARQAFRERGPRPMKVVKAAVAEALPPPAVRQFNLVDGALVKLSKNAIGFRLGADVNPYVSLQKGDMGVLLYRDLVSNGTRARPTRSARHAPLCHVMMAGAVVELPQSVIRAVEETDSDD